VAPAAASPASRLLAGDQHLGDGGGFRVREHAVHVAHEVAAQRIRNRTPAAARDTDADGLHGVRSEIEDVKCRRVNTARPPPIRPRRRCGDDDVFEDSGPAPVDAREADGKDG